MQATGQPMRDPSPRIFLVASTTGGTGSGMVLGLAYAIRQVLAELGLSADGLCGVLLQSMNVLMLSTVRKSALTTSALTLLRCGLIPPSSSDVTACLRSSTARTPASFAEVSATM